MELSSHSSVEDIDGSIFKVGWAFIIVGVIVAGMGLTWMTKTALFLRRAVRTSGEITTVEAIVGTKAGREDPFEGTTYKPVVAYLDAAGVRHVVKSSRAAGSATFNVGDVVQVCYDPADPEQMFIDHARVLWLAPGIVSGLGLFFVGFVGGCFYLMMRGQQG